MATITFFSEIRAFANTLALKSHQIRDCIENVGADGVHAASGGVAGGERPALVDKMLDQLAAVEQSGDKLTRQTLKAKRVLGSRKIADTASRLRSRCTAEMASIERFLKKYGYRGNFANPTESLESSQSDSGSTVAPESTAASSDADNSDKVQVQQTESNSADVAASHAQDGEVTTTTTMTTTTTSTTPMKPEEDDGENEGDISTVQKEPQNEPREAVGTPVAMLMDNSTVIVDALDLDLDDADATLVPCTPEQVGGRDKQAERNVPAVEEKMENQMTIGFKDEPEPVGTPVLDDCGFSALTMQVIQTNRPNANGGKPFALDAEFDKRYKGSNRKISLGAQSEGSPALPEMKSVKFVRNAAAALDRTPDLQLSQNLALLRDADGSEDHTASVAQAERQEEEEADVNPKANLNFSVLAGDDDIATPAGTPKAKADSIAEQPAPRQQAQAAEGTPQPPSPDGAPAFPSLDHIKEFSSMASEAKPNVPSACIAEVMPEDLENVPAYLRSQFSCEQLNEHVAHINKLFAEAGEHASDTMVTAEQIRGHVDLPSSKAKALVLLLVKMKKLRIVAKDTYTLPK